MVYVQSVLVAIVAGLCIQTSDATRCAPNSKFKIDCNNCICDKNGWEYKCTHNICPPIPYEKKFYVEQTKDGHVILTPKENLDDFPIPGDHLIIFDDNNKFVINEKPRFTRVASENVFPYINDEISLSNEVQEAKDNRAQEDPEIPIVDEKFDIDERFDFDGNNQNAKNENERYEGMDNRIIDDNADEELEQNDDPYENERYRLNSEK